MTQTAKTYVSDIIQTKDVPMTFNTVNWIESLHQAGAISVDLNGEVSLDSKVREVIKALHTILAGGKVEINFEAPKSQMFDQLEHQFESALNEAITAVNARRHFTNPIIPFVP
jgi:hypothetical protein